MLVFLAGLDDEEQNGQDDCQSRRTAADQETGIDGELGLVGGLGSFGGLRLLGQLVQDQIAGGDLIAFGIEELAAGAALEVLGNAGGFHGGGLFLHLTQAVALGGDLLAGGNDGAAVKADGVAGVAGSGAGRLVIALQLGLAVAAGDGGGVVGLAVDGVAVNGGELNVAAGDVAVARFQERGGGGGLFQSFFCPAGEGTALVGDGLGGFGEVNAILTAVHFLGGVDALGSYESDLIAEAQGGNDGIGIAMAAGAAGVGGEAVLRGGGRGDGVGIAVADGVQDLMTADVDLAVLAVGAGGVAAFGAVGGLAVIGHRIGVLAGGVLGGEIDADGAVGSGLDPEGVAVAGHSGAAADDGVAGDLITGGGSGNDGGAGQVDGTVGGVAGLGGDGVAFGAGIAAVTAAGAATAVGGFAGGGGHVGGNFPVIQQEGQLRVVNEDVTGAGDGFHGVVAAQLPGVDGVGDDPLQQNIQTFHDTARTPHGGLGPADMLVEHDAGNVAPEVVLAAGFGIGIVVAAAFAVGLIAAGTVLGRAGGAQHHDVVFTVTGALAVGPGMLPVPGGAGVPAGADGQTGIEGRDGLGHLGAVFTVGVLVQKTGLAVIGDMGMVLLHQGLQGLIQFAGRNIVPGGRTGEDGQSLVSDVVLLVELFGVGGQEGGGGAAVTPVVDVLAAVDIVHGGGFRRCGDAGQKAQHQCQHQQKRQNAAEITLHNRSPFCVNAQ